MQYPRSWRYAALFWLLAALLAGYAVWLGGGAWLLLWPAASCVWVAVAYATRRGAWIGKSARGRFGFLPLLALGPYLLLSELGWRLAWWLDRRPWRDEIVPGLYLGRRPLAGELPPGVALVVDLTSELTNLQPPEGPAYHCLPSMDGTAPHSDALRALIDEVSAHPGPVYIHCAMGRGRSACVVAGVLLARGLARSIADAEEMLRAKRPSAKLTPDQHLSLSRIF